MLLTSLPALLFASNFAAAWMNSSYQHSRTRRGSEPAGKPIATTGSYAWAAPGPGDQRGPCPALNALANHGYLPRNGVATIFEVIDASNTVFGMGSEIALILSAFSGAMNGDVLRFSIGGVDQRVGLPLFGVPTGLIGSHNKAETDASPTRGDLYTSGNNYDVVPEQFKAFYALQLNETEEASNYDIRILTDYRATRYQDSINHNPYFFSDVVSVIVVQAAAYIFPSRLMSNHSGDPNYPNGQFSKKMLKSFFGVPGEYPNFEYAHGHERIPDNWHRRPNDYELVSFLLDIIDAGSKHPEFLSIGGNVGRKNTFIGVDLKDLTNGVYNAHSLLEPGTFGCFLRQVLISQEPDLLFATGPISNLLYSLLNLVPDLACPMLARIDFSRAFAAYPGYTKLKNGMYA